MEDLTGKQFGAYEIVAPLGEGGMGAVYKAYQPAMERFVAVKVLSRTLAESKEFTNRFQREAIMLAQLQHPHILPVFDYGQKDGYSSIVMPFLQNGTLAELLHARRRTLSEIHQIMTQVGGALGYAHARGMIHRDVKPSNVLIDEQGNCLLTDFGLARMIQASSDRLTSAGTIMGTPAYMSPEQGKGDSVDGRTDLYALGVIFYEMLTGQVPYQDPLPMMVVIKHIRDPLPSARELAPELTDAIERVVIKSLAKEPAERYQTAEDLVQAVKKAMQVNLPGRAVSKTMDSVYDRLMKGKSTQNDAAPTKGTDDASPASGEGTFISPRPSKDTP
jgi:serine/threonine protein kinase